VKTLRFVAIALVAACADSATPDEGLDAKLRVAGAHFVRGDMPAATDGPRVASVVLVSTAIRPGATSRALTGALEPPATAAAIALAGDPGYWVLPAGVGDVSSPQFPGIKTELAFSAALAPGTHDLVVRAVAGDKFGSPNVTTLTASSSQPSGVLVVSLSWSNDADLDLHVVDPAGIEIFDRNPTSAARPTPAPPDFVPDGGVLDRDSEAECVADGARAENVVWTNEPPRGHYVVRVDTASMCGVASSYWRVEARLRGAMLAAAEGIATDADTRFSHDRGAGVLAFEFDVP
jgi:hypothetical protein